MSDSYKRPIASDTGNFISHEKMKELTGNHDAEHANQKSMEPHVKAMCFGKDKILELLDQPGATALRIYYGIKIDTDGDGRKEKKMVLVAVNEDGDDILPVDAAPTATGAVAKTTPALILDEGVPCPQYCSGKRP